MIVYDLKTIFSLSIQSVYWFSHKQNQKHYYVPTNSFFVYVFLFLLLKLIFYRYEYEYNLIFLSSISWLECIVAHTKRLIMFCQLLNNTNTFSITKHSSRKEKEKKSHALFCHFRFVLSNVIQNISTSLIIISWNHLWVISSKYPLFFHLKPFFYFYCDSS